MTIHSTIRTVLRALVAGLFAAGFTSAWPLSAEAGKSVGGGNVQTHDMSVTKKVDRASPLLYEKTSKGQHIKSGKIEMRKTNGGMPNKNSTSAGSGAGKTQ